MIISKLPDLHQVDKEHHAIDARLKNWARWLQPSKQNWVSPMFAQYRSKAWQWARPEVKDVLDTLDAMKLEKAVCALPDKHKVAVRWAYVLKCTPIHVCRTLGVNTQGLYDSLIDGRTMLINRLT